MSFVLVSRGIKGGFLGVVFRARNCCRVKKVILGYFGSKKVILCNFRLFQVISGSKSHFKSFSADFVYFPQSHPVNYFFKLFITFCRYCFSYFFDSFFVVAGVEVSLGKVQSGFYGRLRQVFILDIGLPVIRKFFEIFQNITELLNEIA